MALPFEKDFISHCKKQNLEINPSQIDLVKKLQKILKTNKKIYFRNNLKSPKFAILDNSKLHKLIKTKKNFEISIGLKKTAQYYKNKIND